jgi:hypothetical protein
MIKFLRGSDLTGDVASLESAVSPRPAAGEHHGRRPGLRSAIRIWGGRDGKERPRPRQELRAPGPRPVRARLASGRAGGSARRGSC